MDYTKFLEYYKVGKLADGREAIAVIGRILALYEKTYHATIYVKAPKNSFGYEEIKRKMSTSIDDKRLTDIWDLIPGEGESFQSRQFSSIINELGWKT